MSNLTALVPSSVRPGVTASTWVVPYALILSPECDLLRCFDSRAKPKFPGYHAVLCVGDTFEKLSPQTGVSSEKVKQNEVPRWAFVRQCPAHLDRSGLGIDDLLFDFRNTISVPAHALWEAGSEVRRTQLVGNYALHVVQRFLSYCGRVPLDVDHNKDFGTDPISAAT